MRECKTWIPWNLSFHYILFHEKGLQTMLWHHNARVNSHQRWKQTQFPVCFHLWCKLTSAMNVTEWQVSWNSCRMLHFPHLFLILASQLIFNISLTLFLFVRSFFISDFHLFQISNRPSECRVEVIYFRCFYFVENFICVVE